MQTETEQVQAIVDEDLPKFIRLRLREYGEPLEWQFLGDQTPDRPTYLLCRCGKSAKQPYCDGTHRRSGFVAP